MSIETIEFPCGCKVVRAPSSVLARIPWAFTECRRSGCMQVRQAEVTPVRKIVEPQGLFVRIRALEDKVATQQKHVNRDKIAEMEAQLDYLQYKTKSLENWVELWQKLPNG